MSQITVNAVVIPEDRQRRKIDEAYIGELAHSIQANGLINAIVLRDDSETLVAGECRLQAIKMNQAMGLGPYRYGDTMIDAGVIPYIRQAQLTNEQLISIELEENLRRRPLTVQEEAAAVAKLHAAREGATKTETAEVLRDLGMTSMDAEDVSTNLLIADHLDNPDVAKAKNRTEALRAVKKQRTKEHHAKLAEEFDMKSKDQTRHVLVNGECRNIMGKMPNACVDVLLTDPPYGVDADNFGSQASTGHDYQDSAKFVWEELMPECVMHWYRIMKTNSHGYAFCDIRYWFVLEEMLEEVGFAVWPRPLLWSKGNGMLPRPEHGPRYTYEAILFFTKGDRRVTGVYADVLPIPPVNNPQHGAEKPVALYEDLLRRSVAPGDHVLDCFAGTGTILPAANRLRCVATAIEQSETHYGLMTTRTEGTEE